MNDIITLEQKRIELQDTVWLNRGSFLFKKIIADTLKKDFIESKMRSFRVSSDEFSSAYEVAAAVYYSKYGTAGEF